MLSREKAAPGKSIVREWAEAIIVALLLALFIRTFFVQAFKIPSGSMLPTLQIGDHLLVNKLLYGIRVPIVGKRYFDFFAPERGDIIVFVFPEDPAKDFIKRVVGIPGDVLEIREKKLFRNGQMVDDGDEPYAQYLDQSQNKVPRDNWGPETVPEGNVFVLGDNRDRSYDSRFWGFVPFENIKGKAVVIYWSWDGEETWVRFNRIGNLLQ
ncbi:MAG: signal peptidase I [Candidatus Binatia bacterium]|nr:signal peptidase I [Candidatus Binatia bacterium]MDG1958799.1 signal peptidase I [Candidatus Binatia bacterium]MDG2011024.1 signal peptidase I [Candidatus Binatia bacterium]HAC78700.1 signal peptidase I [Deltaproteobacteria bacterium]